MSRSGDLVSALNKIGVYGEVVLAVSVEPDSTEFKTIRE